MKTLVLVRHAKSSWDNENIPDFARPLNHRGEHDAPKMAKRLHELGIKPDLIYSSPAERAIRTAKIFADELSCNYTKIIADKLIYDEGANSIMKLLQDTSKQHNCIMLFGHNPIITYLGELLGTFDEKFPTCGVACFDFDIETWEDLGVIPGKLRFFEYPKKYS